MNEAPNEGNSGCGCNLGFWPGLLGVLFIALKLTHQIDWSWWWVTCPLWAGYALMGLFIFAFFGGFAALLGLIGLADWYEHRRR